VDFSTLHGEPMSKRVLDEEHGVQSKRKKVTNQLKESTLDNVVGKNKKKENSGGQSSGLGG